MGRNAPFEPGAWGRSATNKPHYAGIVHCLPLHFYAIVTVGENALYAYSTGSGGLLFGYDFIKFVKNTLVPSEMERFISDFEKMEDTILLISLYKLQRGQIVPTHIFSRNTYLKISNIINFTHRIILLSVKRSKSAARCVPKKNCPGRLSGSISAISASIALSDITCPLVSGTMV